jgi:hypothetical protein
MIDTSEIMMCKDTYDFVCFTEWFNTNIPTFSVSFKYHVLTSVIASTVEVECVTSELPEAFHHQALLHFFSVSQV